MSVHEITKLAVSVLAFQ